ncbi:MAG: threonine aldolase family protein [Acidobacteriota bacterium]
MSVKIDLYSDTATLPTQAMREFMCRAEVGDEQKFEDPTVNRLQDKVAELLGQEAALFLPSGTMCNQISIVLHCRLGEELLLDDTAHPLNAEGGGPAALAGAMVRGIPGERGVFTADQLRHAIRPISRYQPRTRLVSIEQTANMAGGTVWPLQTIREVSAVAREHNLKLHMDGARLLNAVVATGIAAKEFARGFDSVWIDFSKGLGAPVGATLAGSRDFIKEAWQWKQRLGGAMRQAGIIAAAGIYALDHHVDRLQEDHDNAQYLAQGLAGIRGIELNPQHVETNIVVFGVRGSGRTAQEISNRLLENGVRMTVAGSFRMRAVTHLDISRAMVEEAIRVTKRVFES